jgi:hypothetical protein
MATKQFSGATKPFFACRAELSKQPIATKPVATTAERAELLPGDSEMQTLGFVLACVFVLASSTMAGSAEGSLPSVGAFTYSGSPVAVSHAMVVATGSDATE